MDEETFMLLSMKDSKSVADALSNKTAQKIISYLAENKEATESELSEKLETPLPTVHYNIEQLKKANLVKSKEFYWSKKGKKMRVFTLAKKYIIISPEKSSKSTLKQLKGLLPVTLISVIGAGLIHLFQRSKTSMVARDETFNAITEQATEAAGKQVADAGTNLLTNATNLPTETLAEPNLALWFLLGSLFAIVITLVINKVKKN